MFLCLSPKLSELTSFYFTSCYFEKVEIRKLVYLLKSKNELKNESYNQFFGIFLFIFLKLKIKLSKIKN